jgi:outer membrane autotransporter protein
MALTLDPFAGQSASAGPTRALEFADPRARPAAGAFAAAMPTKAPPAVFEPHWTTWGAAYGAATALSGDANAGSHDTRVSSAGVAAGADYRVSPDTVVGLALAGGGTSWGLSQNLGTGRSDNFQAGLYGATRSGPAYLSGVLAYALNQASTDRPLGLGGPETLDASFHSVSFGTRFESGYRMTLSTFGLTPYAAVQAISLSTPAYSETANGGAGTFALSYAARNTSDATTEVGAWVDQRQALADGSLLTLRARAAWVHDFNTDRNADAVFQNLAGASFVVAGATPAADAALVSAGAGLRLPGGVSFDVKFDGELGHSLQSYGGTAAIRYQW